MKQKNELNTLNDLMALAGHYANSAILKSGCLNPTFFWAGAQGPMCCLLGSMATLKDKVACADLARLICLAFNASACVTATESWVVLAKPGETLDMNQRPSESLERLEVVMLMGESSDRQCHEILKIIRSDNGRFFGLSKFVHPHTTGRMKGRFTQFIPIAIPDRSAQLQAQAKLQDTGVVFHVLE